MSVYQYVKVWEHQFKPAQKLVLLALADHADKYGERIFPGFTRIARMTGYSYRQIQRIMLELEEMGVAEVVKPHTHEMPAHYRLNWDNATPLPTGPDDREDIVTKPSTIVTAKVMSSCRDAQMSSEPSTLLKDQNQKPPIDTDTPNLGSVTPIGSPQKKSRVPDIISFSGEVLTIWGEEKRPEWTGHKTVSDQAAKHLGQFFRELRKLGITDEPEKMAAFRVAVRQAAREDWTRGKPLTMVNLGTNGKWFEFYEKGIDAGLSAESPVLPPGVSGVGTGATRTPAGAPVAISRDVGHTLKGAKVTWEDPDVGYRLAGEVYDYATFEDGDTLHVLNYGVRVTSIIEYGSMDRKLADENLLGSIQRLTPEEIGSFEHSESESTGDE